MTDKRPDTLITLKNHNEIIQKMIDDTTIINDNMQFAKFLSVKPRDSTNALKMCILNLVDFYNDVNEYFDDPGNKFCEDRVMRERDEYFQTLMDCIIIIRNIDNLMFRR